MQYQPPITDPDIIDGLSVWNLKLFGFLKIINDYRSTGRRNLFLKFKFIMTFLVCTPFLAFQILSYFTIDMDIQKATIINIHCLPVIMTCCRSLVFWFRIDSHCKLFSLTRKDFLHISKNRMTETRNMYKKITGISNSLCMIAFILDFSLILLTVGVPGIPVDYVLYHTGSMFQVTTGIKKLTSGWYPLPIAESPYYEIIFTYEAILVTTCGIYLPVYACLFYQVLVALQAQFLALGHHVSTLNIDFNNKQSKKIKHQNGNLAMSEDMYRILQDHLKLLSYADELRSVYNPMVTMILGLAVSLHFVFIFQYHMGETGDFIFVLTGILFIAAEFVELIMFCYGSSSIETASSDLQFAVYSSDWYKADVNFRKTAQMMMVGSKKGVTLTAVKMYPVNLETLVSIFQFVYSTSALMSRMLEK